MSGAECLIYQSRPSYDELKNVFKGVLGMKTASKPFCSYSCANMTTLNPILISLSYVEIVFGPETALTQETNDPLELCVY